MKEKNHNRKQSFTVSWTKKEPKTTRSRVGMMYCFRNCSKNNN
jgi:hypothetical protein